MEPTTEQAEVIACGPGTTLVLAAVGSGKTSTLAALLGAALAGGLPPARALAVTFTNRAARHLRARLGPSAAAVDAGTLHALALRVLREAAPALGLSPSLRPIDVEDALEVYTEVADSPFDVRARFQALQAGLAQAPDAEVSAAGWAAGGPGGGRAAARYVAALGRLGVVCFGGLLYLARAAWRASPALRAAWAGRYDLVLVDEVQDTHAAELDLLLPLLQGAQRRVLVGDLDQSIYGFRGVLPAEVEAGLERELGPVRRLTLSRNFRSTPALVGFAREIAAQMGERRSAIAPPGDAPPGPPVRRVQPADPADEAAAVADWARARAAEGVPWREMAVLVRRAALARPLLAALPAAGVPVVSAEQWAPIQSGPGRRVMRVLGAVVVPPVEHAARALAKKRLVDDGAGAEAFVECAGRLRAAGLRWGDLLGPAGAAGPFAFLEAGDAVVLDTETTGTDPARDALVEIAALRLAGGVPVEGPAGVFSVLVRPGRPVGDSERVHGLSDARLAAEGMPAGDALRALAAFVGDRPVIGHNIAFDLAFLQAAAAAAGVAWAPRFGGDTLDAARRLLPGLPRHRLADLRDHLALEPANTHRALDDVRCTVALCAALRARAAAGSAGRAALVAELAGPLEPLARVLASLREPGLRPAEVAARVVARLTRQAATAKERAQLEQVPVLIGWADPGPAVSAEAALRAVVDQAALRDTEELLAGQDGVRVLTIHKSKGLEFDAVALTGLVEGVLPDGRARTPAELEEERRVFFVAATRARRHLLLSAPHRTDRGPAQPSRFFAPAAPPPAPPSG